jgi:hypothetical protein
MFSPPYHKIYKTIDYGGEMKGRGMVKCSFCNEQLIRNIWSYTRNAPIDNFFCNVKCKSKWQVLQRENLGFTKEWLIDEYINKRKSSDQIAREIGRDAKRVWEWIRDYGIPKRPRGTDYGNGFVKGQESPFKGKKHSESTKEKIRKKRIEDGHVPYLKNGKHWLAGTKGLSPNYQGGITPERQAFYSSNEWVEAVKIVWKRDKNLCQKCGKNHNEEKFRGTFHIHHIVSFKVVELRASPENLILLCRSCHLWVHSKKNINKEFIG